MSCIMISKQDRMSVTIILFCAYFRNPFKIFMYPNFNQDHQNQLKIKKDRPKLQNSCKNKNNHLKNLIIKIKKINRELLIGIFLLSSKPNITMAVNNQASISRMDNSDLTMLQNSNSIINLISKVRGGSNNLEKNEQDPLIRSIIEKSPQSNYSDISINKIFKQLVHKLDPIICDHRFLTILNECTKPTTVSIQSYEINPKVIKNPKTNNQARTFIFTEALTPQATHLSSNIQKRIQLKMMNKDVSQSCEVNKQDSQLFKTNEKLNIVKNRRVLPLYLSTVLGEEYKYSLKQLEVKGKRHLEEFGILDNYKNDTQRGLVYKDALETILSKSNLIINKSANFTQNENTTIFGDPESNIVVVFENDDLQKSHFFISGYKVKTFNFNKFNETGQLGTSKEEKLQYIARSKEKKIQIQKEKMNSRLFYDQLPLNARISKKQLNEVEQITKQLKTDKNIRLTKSQKKLIERAKYYKKSKAQFDSNNSNNH